MWKPIALSAALAIASTGFAQAQQCSSRDQILALLGTKYQESPVALGVTTNGKLIEVLKSSPASKKDTWTIVITAPDGLTCLIAAGEGLRFLETEAREPEA